MSAKLKGQIDVCLAHDDVARILQEALVKNYGPFEGLVVASVTLGPDADDTDFLIVRLDAKPEEAE